MQMFYDGGFFMGGMHGLWWIFFIVLIGVLAFYAWGRPGQQGRQSHDTAHDILRRRLASGELTPEQYEERKALLDRDAGKG